MKNLAGKDINPKISPILFLMKDGATIVFDVQNIAYTIEHIFHL